MIIECGLPTYDDTVYISIADDYGSGECSVYYYSIENGESWFHWLGIRVNLIGMCLEDAESDDILHFMDEEGFYSQASNSEKLSTWKKINDAGVYSESAKNYGYLHRLRILNGDLYAVGHSGQIYKKQKNELKWNHFDKGILQKPIAQKSPTEMLINLRDIAGIDGDLYCCGRYSNLFHFSKNKWERINISSFYGDLSEILYKSSNDVYICGYNGALLHGNKESGFLNICPEHINDNFISIAEYKGDIYLACDNNKLYQCEYNGGNFKEINILNRDDISFNSLVSTGEILWSIGFREVIYFNGDEWIAIPNPKDSE